MNGEIVSLKAKQNYPLIITIKKIPTRFICFFDTVLI